MADNSGAGWEGGDEAGLGTVRVYLVYRCVRVSQPGLGPGSINMFLGGIGALTVEILCFLWMQDRFLSPGRSGSVPIGSGFLWGRDKTG